MVYNKFDNNQSGRRNFGRRDFGGPAGVRQMHKTICSSCGRECEVPFKPSGNKPVFCSNCFEKNRGGSDTGRSDTRRFEDRNNKSPQSSEQYNTINTKLDKILAMLTSNSLVKVAPTPNLLPPENLVVIVEKKKKTLKKAVLPPEV